MLNPKKTVVIAVVVLLAISGCQDTGVRSDNWKQEQIATMYRKYAQEFPQVEGITVQQLQQLQQQGRQLVLVDVRSPEERAVSFIPGAISTEEFEQNLAQYHQAIAVAYCTIGYRSGKYAQKMQQQGIKMLNLEGSLLAWTHIHGELTNATGKTKKVHVFDRQWQLTAEDYEAIW